MSDITDQELAQNRLDSLLSEHRDLDDVIGRLGEEGPMDQLQMQRLKKRKLLLKDEIIKLKGPGLFSKITGGEGFPGGSALGDPSWGIHLGDPSGDSLGGTSLGDPL